MAPGAPVAPATGALRALYRYDGHDMRSLTRRLSLPAVAILAIAVGACSSSSADATGTAPATATSAASSEPLEPTEPPGSEEPTPSQATTTQTAWGTILDAVPDGFPVYPDARIADLPATPVSAAYISSSPVGEVATWYRDALEVLGYSTMNLSDPLEDGSRILDSQADLPECRIQATFRPAGGSTMITVLYAAGCAGGEG